jgi:hypothetical protein
MSWKFQPAVEAFEEVRKNWDALNRAQHNHILLDSRFVSLLLRHFGSRNILVGISDDSRKPGMVLVERKAVGIWETFQPSQAPIGLLLLGFKDEQGESLLDVGRCLPGLCLQFAALQQDPEFSLLPIVAPNSSFEVLDYVQTGRLRLSGSFEEYWGGRSKDLRDNVARRLRRSQKENRKLELVVHREASSMEACLREYGRMESAGWKAREGTAITQDNAQGRFYREVLESFAELGEAHVFELRLDGKVIGSELYIGRKDMLIGLKTTYDESLRSMSPGFLMKHAIIREIFDEGVFQKIEFYGRVMEWHNKWITESRTMFHVNAFRNRLSAQLRKLLKRVLSM